MRELEDELKSAIKENQTIENITKIIEEILHEVNSANFLAESNIVAYTIEYGSENVAEYILNKFIQLGKDDPRYLECLWRNGYERGLLIHLACERGYEKVLEILLNLIPKNNPESYYIVNALNNFGWTPIKIACRENNTDIIDMLLAHGADPTILDNEGNSCLSVASTHNHITLIKKLFLKVPEMSSILNFQNEIGATPLFGACWFGHVDMVKLLLELGADFSLRKLNSRTPLFTTLANPFLRTSINMTKILAILSEYGAFIGITLEDDDMEIIKSTKVFQMNPDQPNLLFGTRYQGKSIEGFNIEIEAKKLIPIIINQMLNPQIHDSRKVFNIISRLRHLLRDETASQFLSSEERLVIKGILKATNLHSLKFMLMELLNDPEYINKINSFQLLPPELMGNLPKLASTPFYKNLTPRQLTQNQQRNELIALKLSLSNLKFILSKNQEKSKPLYHIEQHECWHAGCRFIFGAGAIIAFASGIILMLSYLQNKDDYPEKANNDKKIMAVTFSLSVIFAFLFFVPNYIKYFISQFNKQVRKSTYLASFNDINEFIIKLNEIKNFSSLSTELRIKLEDFILNLSLEQDVDEIITLLDSDFIERLITINYQDYNLLGRVSMFAAVENIPSNKGVEHVIDVGGFDSEEEEPLLRKNRK